MQYIVYSHTDYTDILQIQADYLVSKETVLFINEETELSKKFGRVVVYNDKLPYAGRIVDCLNQFNPNKYFVFIHDVDILLKSDDFLLDEIANIMRMYDIGRVDLKIDRCDTNAKNPRIEIPYTSPIYLRLDTESDFTYNVNPSIWDAGELYHAMKTNELLGYREIELSRDIQRWCKCIKTHRFTCSYEHIIKAGYYDCTYLFKYLHITHGGRLLPINEEMLSSHGQSYSDVAEEYWAIAQKYLKESPRW